ncbi:MAG: N-acetyltransferase family protein [Nitrososphaerales archaeon]
MVETRRLPADRWRDYRDLRWEALKCDPSALGSSFEEEETLSEEERRGRIWNVLSALSFDEPIRMIVYVFDDGLRPSTSPRFSVCTSAPTIEAKVGTRLFERALLLIQKNKGIVTVELGVNPEQRAAIKLYRKAGFVATGRVKKEPKVGRRFFGMLFMEKVLRRGRPPSNPDSLNRITRNCLWTTATETKGGRSRRLS